MVSKLLLRSDDVLKRGFELRRELPVSDEHHADHVSQGSIAHEGRKDYFCALRSRLQASCDVLLNIRSHPCHEEHACAIG